MSAACAWEIATKVRSGKMPDMVGRMETYEADLAAEEFKVLPIEQRHALKAGLFPGEHRDPFDRMLAAQSLAERMMVVTRDRAFVGFGCAVLW